MPTGSNYTAQLAFNARGYNEFGYVPSYAPNVNPATMRLRDEFLWVSHTWNHIDMYCINSDCTKQVSLPFSYAFSLCVWPGGLL